MDIKEQNEIKLLKETIALDNEIAEKKVVLQVLDAKKQGLIVEIGKNNDGQYRVASISSDYGKDCIANKNLKRLVR